MQLKSLFVVLLLGILIGTTDAAEGKKKRKRRSPKNGAKALDPSVANMAKSMGKDILGSFGLKGMGATVMKFYDTDGDGIVTVEEKEAYLAKEDITEVERAKAKQMFTVLDKNGDGEITSEEAADALDNFGSGIEGMKKRLGKEEFSKLASEGKKKASMHGSMPQMPDMSKYMESIQKMGETKDMEGLKNLQAELSKHRPPMGASVSDQILKLEKEAEEIANDPTKSEAEKRQAVDMMAQVKSMSSEETTDSLLSDIMGSMDKNSIPQMRKVMTDVATKAKKKAEQENSAQVWKARAEQEEKQSKKASAKKATKRAEHDEF